MIQLSDLSTFSAAAARRAVLDADLIIPISWTYEITDDAGIKGEDE